MSKLKKYLNEEEQEFKEIELKVRDREGTLEELLNYIKDIGNIGHSFEIVVDPDNSEYKKTFGWDGDGADYIKNIKVESAKNEESEKE